MNKVKGHRGIILTKAYQLAKEQGRLCTRCGWIVTVVRWKHGKTTCSGCEDLGPYPHNPCGPAMDEPQDKTGEAL